MGQDTSELVARWRAGDEEGADALFSRYAQRLIALARSRLSPKLARRMDPEDVVQSAYRSFFVGAREGRYFFRRSGDLWRLLVAITLHKLHHQIERHTAGKRTVDREETFGSGSGLYNALAATAAPEASPFEALALVDELHEMMARLEPSQRRVLEMRLQGNSVTEIAVETDRSERTVRRVLEKLRHELERRLVQGE